MAKSFEDRVVAVLSDGGTVGPSPSSKWQHPPSFYCPISQQFMHDPVVLSDGHSYERKYIERWLQDHSTSPVSGLLLLQKSVFPNHSLRNAIEEYFNQVFSAHRTAIRKTMGDPLSGGDVAPSVSLVRAIDALMQCSLLVNADMDIECVLKKIMDEAKTLLGAEVASVFLLDAECEELYSTVNSTGRELRIPITVGIAGCVARSGEPLVIHDAYSDGRFDRTVDVKTGFRTRSILCVPLKDRKGGIIGVAQLINKTASRTIAAVEQPPRQEESKVGDTFTADDLHFLMVFASQAATAIMTSSAFMSPMTQVANQVTFCSEASDCSRSSTSAKERRLSEHPFRPLKGHSAVADRMLDHAFHSWEFDALALAEVTANKPLSTLAVYLFDRLELPSKLDLDRERLRSFFEEVEMGYDDANPYHNRAHAASVLHSMHAFLEHGGLLRAAAPAFVGEESCGSQCEDRAKSDDWVRMACFLAAAIHDYEHEGLNNDFLVKTSHERAIRYNDQHVNEQHHVAAAFDLLLQPENDFLARLPVENFRRVRGLVIDLVLGTDMAQHGKLLQAAVEALDAHSGAEVAFAPASRGQGVLLLQIAMKCSDLGHLALDWKLHVKWVRLLEEEFFLQGDKEREAGLNVSFNMDRCKPGASATQVGFLDFVVLPLFKTLARAAPGASAALAAVEANYSQWKRLEEEAAPKKETAPKEEAASQEQAIVKEEVVPEKDAAAVAEEGKAPSASGEPKRTVRRRGTERTTASLPTTDALQQPGASSEVAEAEEASVSPVSSTASSLSEASGSSASRKKRSGRARQRAAKFWAAIRRPTPSRSPSPFRG